MVVTTTTTTRIRGIKNPATACHVSSPLLVLAYGVAPLAQAILAAAPLQKSPFWHAWARVLRQLLLSHNVDNDDDQSRSVGDDDDAVNPDDFYQSLLEQQQQVGINPHELGDAITSLAKLLNLLQEDELVGEMARELLYAGRCCTVITGQRYDTDSQTFRRRIKTTKEKSLPVPFYVSSDNKDMVSSLHQLLLHALSARPVTGYKWSSPDTFQETILASCPDNVPADQSDHDDDWPTTRKLEINALAPFWLIHVDHFSLVHGRVRSRQTPCAIPLELDVSKYSQPPSQGENPSCLYRLSSAILHLSSNEEKDEEEDGHYTTLVRSSRNDDSTCWVLIDDCKTTEVSEETCLNLLAGCHTNLSENGSYMQASLLVYERMNAKEMVEQTMNRLLSREKEIKLQQESLVGRRLEILWSKGKYYAGAVVSFDSTTRKHTVRYDDGDVRTYNLSKKTVRWLDDYRLEDGSSSEEN